jgi:hypothetical protein
VPPPVLRSPTRHSDFKDFDGDGRPDVFLSDLVRDTFTLFVNQRKGFFLDRTFPSAIGLASQGHSGSSTKFLDIDDDGWKDIFVAGSHVVDNVELYNKAARHKEGSFLYRNTGQGRIEDLSQQVGPDLQVPGAWRGVAVADLDDDGSLELAVSQLGGPAALFVKHGGAPQQLDAARPAGHEEQPRRDRRAREAGAALGPRAVRARDHGERDLLRQRQAGALRPGRRRASTTWRSPGPAGSCSASRSPPSSACCTSWRRPAEGARPASRLRRRACVARSRGRRLSRERAS